MVPSTASTSAAALATGRVVWTDDAPSEVVVSVTASAAVSLLTLVVSVMGAVPTEPTSFHGSLACAVDGLASSGTPFASRLGSLYDAMT